ncbi:MAG: apolipoprotein N-acyltransferase [Candidatus Omnitrophica bacterium]|nr:apolipoprotein N-acyltransferase [Candidatus Omnitrophota bacterium]
MNLPKSILCCFGSAFLLVIAYPQIEYWPLAWVALVPLLFALDGKTFRQAWGGGFLFGFLFFFATVGWLMYVTVPGAVLLVAYLALYTAFFARGFVYFQKFPVISRVFVLSSLWTVLEFIRAHLFTGFGWVMLGHSQYKNLLLIQIADITGVYGVSFLVVLVNLVVFETLRAVFKKEEGVFGKLWRLQMITVGLLSASLVYGVWIFSRGSSSTMVRVAVVQPNIPQKIKWDERYMSFIIRQTLDLTDTAAQDHPDIILWPETSLPGVLSEHPSYFKQIQLKARHLKIPIVMGTIIEDHHHYYNSAVFIDSDGTMRGKYHKIHLVPFGEFLPLRFLLGWINRFVPLEDFTSGTEYTLFPVGNWAHRFGVLICFEDTLDDLWRNFTKAGGEFFMNMTNDAWFMDTKAPFLHLQAAVFECVQNKRSLVRAANTGVSGFVDSLGRIIALAHDPTGKKTFVRATASADIPLEHRETFYTKYASFFTTLCFACILWALAVARKRYA